MNSHGDSRNHSLSQNGVSQNIRNDSAYTQHEHPHHDQRQPQQQQNQHQHVADLLQYAQSSYNTRPTDALSALMEALTIQTGTTAAQQAMDRIRNELGDTVANCVAINVASHRNGSTQPTLQTSQSSQNHHANFGNSQDSMTQQQQQMATQRAMAIVEEMLNDSSTFLYAQGKQHILQQAMEDGSSVVCTKCGDMIKADRWMQHAEYWCRSIQDEGGESNM